MSLACCLSDFRLKDSFIVPFLDAFQQFTSSKGRRWREIITKVERWQRMPFSIILKFMIFSERLWKYFWWWNRIVGGTLLAHPIICRQRRRSEEKTAFNERELLSKSHRFPFTLRALKAAAQRLMTMWEHHKNINSLLCRSTTEEEGSETALRKHIKVIELGLVLAWSVVCCVIWGRGKMEQLWRRVSDMNIDSSDENIYIVIFIDVFVAYIATHTDCLLLMELWVSASAGGSDY